MLAVPPQGRSGGERLWALSASGQQRCDYSSQGCPGDVRRQLHGVRIVSQVFHMLTAVKAANSSGSSLNSGAKRVFSSSRARSTCSLR